MANNYQEVAGSESIKRVKTKFENKRDKIGNVIEGIEGCEPYYVEDYIQHLALDVVESYSEIKKGEKKREETNIDLQMQVLGSLSNSLKALSSILYH